MELQRVTFNLLPFLVLLSKLQQAQGSACNEEFTAVLQTCLPQIASIMVNLTHATSPLPASTLSKLAAGIQAEANCCSRSKAFFTQATNDRCACDQDYKHSLAAMLDNSTPCGLVAMVELSGIVCGFQAVPLTCLTGTQCVLCGSMKTCVA